MGPQTTPPPLPESIHSNAAKADSEAICCSAPPVTDTGFHVEPNGSLERLQGVSSWLVSAVVHLVIVLLFALIAIPYQTGLLDSITLSLSSGDDAPQPEFSLSQNEVVTLEQPSIDEPAPIEESLDLVRDAQIPEVSDSTPSQIASVAPPTELASPIGGDKGEKDKAMFFGTSASGRTFIFILDCSGSMQARGGERFERARDELVNSISRLSSDQEFYVFLFNWSTMPMFGTILDPGRPIPATSENVSKLQAWLYNIVPESGTDPRRALIGSYAMNPDAIFLLSDGRFNTPPYTDPLLGWDSSQTAVSDIVALQRSVQVNAIAFEDVIASRGMEELASITGGEFRFVTEPDPRFGNQAPVANNLPPGFDGPEYTPVTPEEKRVLSEKVLLLRRAEKLAQRGRKQNAIDLVKEIDPLTLPIEFRKRLAAIYR